MAEIVNLRQARKRIAREKAEKASAENRVTFGMSRKDKAKAGSEREKILNCLLYTSPSPRDRQKSRMPSSA